MGSNPVRVTRTSEPPLCGRLFLIEGGERLSEKNNSRLAVRRTVLARNADWMRDYMKSYYNEDEEIQRAMLVKESHTGRVQNVIRDLAIHLELSEEDVVLAELMGLLHDVGRFRQFTVYRTFKDHLSEDHATAGLKLMEEHRLLEGLLPWEQSLVRFAVEWHNLRESNLFIPTKIKKFRTQVSNFGLLKRYIYRTQKSKAPKTKFWGKNER